MRKVIYLVIVISILYFNNLYSQSIFKSETQKTDIEIEQFMGMLDGIYSDNQIDNMSYLLPSELKIVNYGIGKFSDFGNYDLAIAYKDATCSAKTLKVILLVNIGDKVFKKVFESEEEWTDTPFDIAFNISNNIISISHRKNISWLFSYFTYDDGRIRFIKEEKY